MTPDQISLTRATFDALEGRQLDPTCVYERLFEMHPELRQRFPEPLGALPRNFWSGLCGLVARLDDVAGLTAEASAAAAHHRNMGVNSEEFEFVGQALDDVARATLGDGYTEQHHEAMRRTWVLVTEVLQQRPRATDRTARF